MRLELSVLVGVRMKNGVEEGWELTFRGVAEAGGGGEGRGAGDGGGEGSAPGEGERRASDEHACGERRMGGLEEEEVRRGCVQSTERYLVRVS